MMMATAHCAESPENASIAGKKTASQNRQHQKTGAPDQVIDQQRDKTAADSGQRHLDIHQFRRINVKLI